MLPIAVIGLVANLVAAWLLHRAHTLNVRGAYLHIVSDAMASAAVVLGGVVMMWQDGLWIVDPILGVLIALIVIWGAVRLVREAADVLLEAVPAGVDVERLRQDVRALEGIEDFHDLHIWTITSGLYALSAHIVVTRQTLAERNDELLKRVKQVLLKNHRITHSTLQIESTDYEHVGHVH
jgi:cobalt-zinc-cadmium efflux system protein